MGISFLGSDRRDGHAITPIWISCTGGGAGASESKRRGVGGLTCSQVVGAELFILHYHVPVIGWQVPAALVAGYIAGPAADIDKEESLVGRKLWPVSWIIHTLGIRHRTVTHSIPFIGLLWYL